MPSTAIHVKFDRYLTERGVLLVGKTYRCVHIFIDNGVKAFGPLHRERDPYHNIRQNAHALRKWINGKYSVIKPDVATDFLRAGFGHYALDRVDSDLIKTYGWKSVFDSAYRSMVQLGWCKKFFRPF
jgi:hypothetical protein